MIVTGLTRSVSLPNLYEECGWIPMETRRQEQKLTLIFKSVNGLTPSYISDLIPNLVRNTTDYPLRNSNNLVIPYNRTEISLKSCIPLSVSLWNSLDPNIRSSNSTSHFKTNLKRLRSTNSKDPSYYNTGDGYLSVLHARCSNLNNDLFNNHLRPTSECNCNQGIEDAEHFFFRCPLFAESLVQLFHSTRSFHPPNVNKLIFGVPNATDEENTSICNAAQNFIVL